MDMVAKIPLPECQKTVKKLVGIGNFRKSFSNRDLRSVYATKKVQRT
jgi:hypothetical protein